MKTQYLIIRGPLGCGKSTISEKLTKKLNAEHIAYDRIVDDPKLIKREEEEGYISQKNFLQANKIAFERAKSILDSGKIVIFDGNFYWKSQLDDLTKKLKKYSGKVFTLKAPVETCIKRDANRNKTHGEIAAREVHKKSTSFSYGIEIDNEYKTVEETLNEVLEKFW